MRSQVSARSPEACGFSAYTKGLDWAYSAKATAKLSLEGCEEACDQNAHCTGIELKLQTYCVFWFNGACGATYVNELGDHSKPSSYERALLTAWLCCIILRHLSVSHTYHGKNCLCLCLCLCLYHGMYVSTCPVQT